MILYFAYGSNMDEYRMAHRCSGARYIGVARLPGHRFTINSRGVATAVTDGGREVFGVLWEVTVDDERELDRCEGVGAGLYVKDTLPVARGDGDATLPALIYIAADSTPGFPRPGYLEGIIAAAIRRGLPHAYVRELEGWG